MIDLAQLNTLPAREFVAELASLFEHSPWVPEGVVSMRPFASVIALHRALCDLLLQAGEERQLALIRAHPELAGRAAIRGDLTEASTSEQKGAGLSACTPDQYHRLQRLNAQYGARFGFPFVLAVKGHTPDSVIATLEKRVTHDAEEERRVAVGEICRIAFFRLVDQVREPLGASIIAMCEDLAGLSEDTDALTCSYLTATHRATAARIGDYMRAAGLAVSIDAVSNVVGLLPGGSANARRLMTGSHYDTVIDAGKFDGRLGIVLPIAVAGALRRAGGRLPYPLEIVAFAEEEGVRFKSTFLGSRAVAGRFDLGVLDSLDAQGMSLRDALAAADLNAAAGLDAAAGLNAAAGLDATAGLDAAIAAIARDPAQVAGFVEVHIEQGPVLLDAGLPVGVVTSIAGSVRSIVTVQGLSGHAGTVPMPLRRDAAAAAAEMVLAVERRCGAQPGLVGTVGQLAVPGGAINVIPGRCEFSIDIRSGRDAVRDAAAADIGAELRHIAVRRRVDLVQRQVLEANSVPCTPALEDAWAASIERITARPAHRLPSGAGHDAMMMAGLTGIGMLFVRCGNGGISHHPSETLSVDDADVAARVFQDFLQHFEATE